MYPFFMLGVSPSARTKDHDIMDLSHCRNTGNLRLYDCMGSVYNTQGLSSSIPSDLRTLATYLSSCTTLRDNQR